MLNAITDPEAEKVAWREVLQRDICSRTDFALNRQNVHTPYSLCLEMVDQLERSTVLSDKTFLTFNLEFIEVLCYDCGVKKENIWFLTDCIEKAKVAHRHPRYSGINVIHADYLTWRPNMKFDVICGNPPYNNDTSDKAGGVSRNDLLWPDFVKKSLNLVVDGGYVCLVHPSSWRSPTGQFTETRDSLLQKQIRYLEIHSADDGRKVFGAGTRYDWYVLQNVSPNKETTLKGEDGKTYQFDLKTVPFIPNGMMDEIFALMAKDGEEKVKILADSSYHGSRTDIVSKVRAGEFRFPVIRSIRKSGLNLIYSNSNKRGHFGIPKVVFGRGQSDTYIDRDGKYGLCEDVRGIVDDPENLDFIAQALNSERFIKLSSLCCFTPSSMFQDRYNKSVMALFRKDFWKEFVK